MEVLERTEVLKRSPEFYRNATVDELDNDPWFVKNHPLNVDDWTAEEILASIRKGVRDAEAGRTMTLEEVEEYFHKKYGYAKIVQHSLY